MIIQQKIPFRGCLVKNSVTQPATAAATFFANWDTSIYDTNGIKTSATRLTVPNNVSKIKLYGYISTYITVAFAYQCLYIYKNGAPILYADKRLNSNSTYGMSCNISTPTLIVIPNDFFELYVVFDNANQIDTTSYFGMEIIE